MGEYVMVFEGFPFIVGWELTLACNLRCRHCASSAGTPRNDELTLDEALALCDQFPALAVQEVDFTGGEPLLRPDWWRIAAYVAEKNITTRIVTNGLLLTPEVVARMQDVDIATVGISLDGLEATHDHIRGHSGLWRRVLAGIEQTAEAGIKVGVITAVNARNLSELPALLSILQSAGVNHWQLQPNLPQGRSEGAPDLHLSEQDYVQLGVFFRDQQSKAQENGFKIVPADSLGYFTELDLVDPPWRGCPAGLYSVGITSDGRVKGCLTLPDEVIEGDLRQNDLWDIWFRADAFVYTRQFSVDQMGPACHACDMAEQCKGGCSSMSYVCTRSFHNDPYCFYGIQRRDLEALQPA
jgi:radical SAM protein with 4Fe4S-binding SPASM domain